VNFGVLAPFSLYCIFPAFSDENAGENAM